MSLNTAEEMLKVLQANVDGFIIESRHGIDTKWSKHRGNDFYFETFEYRVKREPIRVWANIYCEKNGATNRVFHETEKNARDCAATNNMRVAVEFVEVMK